MIVTFFLLITFIRSRPWRRQRQAAVTQPPTINNQFDASTNNTLSTTIAETLATTTYNTVPNINNNLQHARETAILPAANALLVSPVSTQRRRSLKTHEVTFSGSVVGGYSDTEATYTTNNKSDKEAINNTKRQVITRRPSTPDSTSSTSVLYHSLSSERTRPTNSTDDYETALTETSRRLLRKKRIYPRYFTVDVETEDRQELMETPSLADADGDAEIEDDSYDRDTEEFYSNIQDATGTTSGSRSKRSSLFSRSDSSATTTSSSGTFTGKRRSAASIISTSICSDIIPLDRRRSSTTTEYSARSTSQTQRHSSGRIRRYISRMTIAGARRRTTGRY